MLKYIQQCTNVEARRVLGNEEWEVSLCEFNVFIALLSVRAAYGGKNFPLYNFWNEEWGVSFFQQTMSRNRCREVIRFLRFDLRSTKSARWQTDKFALISDIWFEVAASVVTNLEKILRFMRNCSRQNLVVGLSSICQTNQISLA